jgi:hypothetical protein
VVRGRRTRIRHVAMVVSGAGCAGGS